MNLIGADPIFSSSGRTTGQGTGIIDGLVPVSIYNRLHKAGKEIISAASYGMSDRRIGSPYSQKDARDTMRLIWGTQMPGVSQLANWAVSESNLPETDRRR